MTKPQIQPSHKKFLPLATRLMGLVGIFALLFVILQSCSLPESNLQRFARGDIRKLVVMEKPPVQPSRTFKNKEGQAVSLADFRGKTVLLNIWATWCAPCVAEIPSLDQLQGEWGGASFVVIAVSVDRDIVQAESFYNTVGVKHLNLYHDMTLGLGGDVRVSALPISILYDERGYEIARIPGEVDWQSDEVSALLTVILSKN